jgi:flagellar biosynthesis GTPase FlhF
MQIRKFYAHSLPAAVRDIRRILGSDAVILSTRELTGEDADILINGQRANVEVTAVREISEPAAPAEWNRPSAKPQPVPPPSLSNRLPEPAFLPGNGSLREYLLRSAKESLLPPQPLAQGETHPVFPVTAPTDRKDETGAQMPVVLDHPNARLTGKTAIQQILRELHDLQEHLEKGADKARETHLGDAPLFPKWPEPPVEAPRELPSHPIPRSMIPGAPVVPPRKTEELDTSSLYPSDLLGKSDSLPVATPSEKTKPGERVSPRARRFREHLQQQEVDPVLADRIVQKMSFAEPSLGVLRASGLGPEMAMRESARVTFQQFVESVKQFVHLPDLESPPTQSAPRRIALVGPTGVGKTTTLAKIASHYALDRGQDVVLVTLDTYRIAAVEQLRTYGRLLGIPVEVAADGQSLQEIFAHYADADLILVDTPGYGPGDSTSLARLGAALRQAEALEVHLLVTASVRPGEMQRVLGAFEPLGYDRLVFSKLDEARHLGEVLNAWNHADLPVSYFTTGQRVPEDLEEASVEYLCKELVTRRDS